MGDPETVRPQRGRAPVAGGRRTRWIRRDSLKGIVRGRNRRAHLRREDVAAVRVAAAALVAMGAEWWTGGAPVRCGEEWDTARSR